MNPTPTQIFLILLTVVATMATGVIALDVFPHGSPWIKVAALTSWVLSAFGITAANKAPSAEQARKIAELEGKTVSVSMPATVTATVPVEPPRPPETPPAA